MDPFSNIPPTIVGSRRPILIPALLDDSSSSSHLPIPTSTVIPTTSSISQSHNRRKPVYVYKSPASEEPGEWEARISTRKCATSPYNQLSARRTSTSTDATGSSSSGSSAAKVAVRRRAPALPLYHPLGLLARSLPKLDPGLFGLPSSLNVDDGGEQGEADSNDRSSSHTRRVAPKAHDAGEDDVQSNGMSNGTGTGKAVQDTAAKDRNPSPRKRRGAGGGAKRKRKDTDDGDGIFPPPAKRTRNPRGVAANSSVPTAPSPLVGPAVVASDLVEEAPETNGEGEQEAQEEVQAPKRSARARKPRTRPVKRRDSSGSASSTTSISLSITVATKAAADDKEAAQTQAKMDRSLPDEGINGAKRREEEPEETDDNFPTQAHVPAPEELQAAAGGGGPSTDQLQTESDVVMNGVTPTPTAPSPSPAPTPMLLPLPPPPQPQHKESPQKEEREEGELSDDS